MKRAKQVYTLILVTLFSVISTLATARETYGTFKDWDYGPDQVYGILKLENPVARHYYKISPDDDGSIKVEEHNASDVIVRTVIITYVNNVLAKVTHTDQWGFTYETVNFLPLGDNRFSVTVFREGKNNLLPCKYLVYTYQNNLRIECRYMGFDDRPCNSANGIAVIKYVNYEDDNRVSLLKEESFYDELDNPAMNKAWDCQKIVYERDETGNELSEAYYNDRGQPVASRYGIFKVLFSWDVNDNETKKSFIGLNGKAAANVYGVAQIRSEYHHGLKAKTTFYDAMHNVVNSKDAGSGIAITTYNYDNKGNLLKKAYFDDKGKQVNDHDGIHQINYEYAADQTLTEMDFFDMYGQPVADEEHVHQYTYLRDAVGRVIQKGFYGNDGAPALNKFDEVYMIKYKYDTVGRIVSRTYWRSKNTPMNRWDAYHEEKTIFNNQGQAIEYSYHGFDGNEVVAAEGYSRTVTIYNTSCRVSEYLRFNGDTPVTATKGVVNNFHSVRYFYDNQNRVSRIEYHDTDGNPALANVTIAGGFQCNQFSIVYAGEKIVKENFYLSGALVKSLDCLKNNYITTSGLATGQANK